MKRFQRDGLYLPYPHSQIITTEEHSDQKNGLNLVFLFFVLHRSTTQCANTDYYDGKDVLEKHLVNPGDLIFSWSATLKAVIWKHQKSILNQHIFKVEANEGISKIFLQQLLDSSLDKLAGSSHGSTMKHIKKGVLNEFHVAFPPLPEQKKIASILTSVDEVIENTQKQIDKLQDLKKATMNELLAKGIGHTEFKDSELGRIPKSWDVKNLGDISKIYFSNVDKKSYSNEIPVFLCNYMDVYNNSCIKDGIEFMRATAKQREIDKFLLLKDDVIITKDSETPDDIAVSAYVSEHLKNVLCGYHLALIRSDKKKLSGAYLAHLFELDDIQHRYYQLANGSTRFGLTSDAVLESSIPVPPLREQESNPALRILTFMDTIQAIEDNELEKTPYKFNPSKNPSCKTS